MIDALLLAAIAVATMFGWYIARSKYFKRHGRALEDHYWAGYKAGRESIHFTPNIRPMRKEFRQ